ncbi:MAG: xanthine dehydrogenase family protein subunit M, partial [Variovorax sp.]
SVGALVRNADLAWHPRVRQSYPLLSQALLAGASPQLRNMATTGGNLLQRTRCYYFYDTATACNKRQPGSGCPATLGVNRIHAILGASDQCVAVHPSDMCVALAALEATVCVEGPRGRRRIAMADFHRLPEGEPERDTTLAADELICTVELPANGFAAHSAYVKVRDRRSYAFALVSVACALDITDERIGVARIALGGVAHKPWRKVEAEALLVGQPARREFFEAAADVLLAGAQPLKHNGFKVELARRTIVRALHQAAGVGEEALP